MLQRVSVAALALLTLLTFPALATAQDADTSYTTPPAFEHVRQWIARVVAIVISPGTEASPTTPARHGVEIIHGGDPVDQEPGDKAPPPSRHGTVIIHGG